MDTRKRSRIKQIQPTEETIQKPRKKKNIQQTPKIIILQDYAHLFRIDSIISTSACNSGHPTSCSSIAEILAVMFFSENGLHFNPKMPQDPLNDRFVLSKGHAVPILYSVLSYHGLIKKEEIINLRKRNSILQGHPRSNIPFIDVATGSLGQGLGIVAGMAYSSKYLQNIDNKYYCLMGDGEIAQGSVWEAANFIPYYKLNNVIAIVDVNKFGQSTQTMFGHNIDNYKKKWESFGWNVMKVDGHNIAQLLNVFERARKSKDPSVILAKTQKGKYFLDIEGNMQFHGKPVSNKIIDALKQKLSPNPPVHSQFLPIIVQQKIDNSFNIIPSFDKSKQIATREAYGIALIALYQSNKSIIGLDADTKNSTFAISLFNKYKQAFVQCFICQMNMVSIALGLSTRNKIPFCSAFACFFSRALDQIRMVNIGNNNVKFVGSHCGCSIGQDGPSQMGLQDLAQFKSFVNMRILYPSDAVSCFKAMQLAAKFIGPVYIRTTRQKTKILYNNDQTFQWGKSKILKKSFKDIICVVSSGITLHQALKAAQQLQKQQINIRLMDLFSIKPIDQQALLSNAIQCNHKILTIQDHNIYGGIYGNQKLIESVCSSLAKYEVKVWGMGIKKVPGSMKPYQQLDDNNINSSSIISKIKQLK